MNTKLEVLYQTNVWGAMQALHSFRFSLDVQIDGGDSKLRVAAYLHVPVLPFLAAGRQDVAHATNLRPAVLSKPSHNLS